MNYNFYNETLEKFLKSEEAKKIDKLMFQRFISRSKDEINFFEEIDLEFEEYKPNDVALLKYKDYTIGDIIITVNDDFEITALILLELHEYSTDNEAANNLEYKYSSVSYGIPIYEKGEVVHDILKLYGSTKSENPTAKLGVNSVYHTKLFLVDDKFPVLRIAWYWEDDHDMNYAEISPPNPNCKTVFDLLELQKSIQGQYTENESHAFKRDLIE